MTDRLTTARANLDAARTELRAAALADLSDRGLGLFWVGEDTEIFIAESEAAIRSARLAEAHDRIVPMDIKGEDMLDALIEAMETCAPALLHGPYQLWSTYAE